MSVLHPHFVGGETVVDLALVVAIERMFSDAFATAYRELTFDGAGDLTVVDVWDTIAKGTKLYTRTLTYSGGDLVTVATLDEVTTDLLTVSLAYSGGDLFSVDKVLS